MRRSEGREFQTLGAEDEKARVSVDLREAIGVYNKESILRRRAECAGGFMKRKRTRKVGR